MNPWTSSFFYVVRCTIVLFMMPLLWLVPVSAQTPALDPGFVAGADNVVNALASLPDGDLVVAGDFTILGGQPRQYIGRLRADGSLVPLAQYSAIVSGGQVSSVLVQDDGRVVIAGTFTHVDNQVRYGLARLLADGTVDPTYVVHVPDGVWTLAPLPDGSLLIGGPFTQVGGQIRLGLARILQSGQVDPGFVSVAAKSVASISVQPDGRILIAGIQILAAEPWPMVQRLLPNGAIDSSFQAQIGPLSVPARVGVLALQPDGRILIGGLFEQVDGSPRRNLARLLPDGRLDADFLSDSDLAVVSLLVQADGRILVGGIDLGWAHPHRKLYRVLGNGQPDSGFHVPIDGVQTTAYAQEDGALLIGGYFSAIGPFAKLNLARLLGPDSSPSRLQVQGGTVHWLREGSVAELSAPPRLALSVDGGASFSELSTMVRVTGGWRADGVHVPAGSDVVLRARGRVRGGRYNGSSGLVEQRWTRTDALFQDGFE